MNSIDLIELIESRSQLLTNYISTSNANFVQIMLTLRHKSHTKGILLKIFDELVNCDTCDLIPQLAVVKIDVFSRKEIEYISKGLKMKSIHYCKNSNWFELYGSYLIMNQLKSLPQELRFELNYLCDTCRLDRLDLKTIGFDTKLDENFKFENLERVVVYNVDETKITIVKRQNVNSFHCLLELLRLLRNNFVDFRVDIENYISYIFKNRGESDEYLNILFPK